MKNLTLILVFAFIVLGHTRAEKLHIISEPDVVVYLNGKVVGITSLDKGGLQIDNLKAGTHIIKLYKLDHLVQLDTINMLAGKSQRYYARPFIKTDSEVAKEYLQTKYIPKGNLKIQSVPVAINVEIAELGLNTKKSEDKMMVNGIASGVYELRFRWNKKTLFYKIEVKEGSETHLFVNMIKNEVTQKSPGKKPKTRTVNSNQIALAN